MPGAIQPDVSVVVIVYNDKDRLPRAVASVLDQTLHNLEVIIADDCSTDGTREVAERLAASDPRVRYLRLPQNSGGCSGPRNAAIEVAKAPHLMFLDSDDELPRHACKSLLLVLEETGADFVTGEVERYETATGDSGLWYPHLFTERVVYQGIRENPEMLFDHLSTNKMYRRDFIDAHDLRFPEGIHYEDQLFSAQAFHLAKSFAVVPWVIYRWHIVNDQANLSISNSRHKIQNLVDRLAVARLVDAFLLDTVPADEYAAAKTAKDVKFLRHDFRLYMGDLPDRDEAWLAQFAEIVLPYLDTLQPEAFERLPRDQRIALHLLRTGRMAEVVQVSRTLGLAVCTPRHATRDAEGRWYWGATPPATDADRSELDITDFHLDRQTFPTALVRHEIERLRHRGSVLRMHIRTYDPGMVLGDGPLKATVQVAALGGPLKAPVELRPSGPGEFAGEAELDLAQVPMAVNGFNGVRQPVLVLQGRDHRHTGVLFAPLRLDPFTVDATYRRYGTHRIEVRTEGRGYRRLDLTWARSGAFEHVSVLGPQQRRVKRRLKKLYKKVSNNETKAAAYRMLSRLPMRKDLVVFEALEGKGYVDNPRSIYEELKRQGRPLHVVWSYTGSGRASFPKDVKLVRRGSWKYVGALARAQYWVDSHNLPSIYTKRPGRHYLQTWHGQTMKTIGYDVPTLRNGPEAAKEKHASMVSRWTMLVSPSREFEKTFVPANRYDGEIVRSGYPRNDVLVRWQDPEQQQRAADVRRKLIVPDGAKVVLYAPTFRDRTGKQGSSIRIDLPELVERLGEGWVVVVRAHYYDRFTVPAALRHVVRNGADFTDVNDLVLASDALVTDYSSLMFDYANLGRPILFFTDDYEEYRNSSRGTYYDLAEMAPGPMLRTTAELADALGSLDEVEAEYAEKYAEFRRMFCSYESGEASKAVVDKFFGEGV